MKLLAQFEKILYMGFRATLNFRIFKVALNPITEFFQTLPNVASHPAYQNSIIRKKFRRAEIIPTCSPVIGQFFDTMIVALNDKEWL